MRRRAIIASFGRHRSAGLKYKSVRDRGILDPAQDFSICQKAVLVSLSGMGFYFHDKLTTQGKNPSQPIARLKWFKLEKTIHQSVPPRKDAVHDPPVEAIQNVFLPRLKCEISSNDGTLRQQPLEDHVGTKVHVVMAVQTARLFSIETTELIDLCLHDIVEITNKQGMKSYLRIALAPQVCSKYALTFQDLSRAVL